MKESTLNFVIEKLNMVADYLIDNNCNTLNEVSLYAGKSGHTLFFANYYKYKKDKFYKEFVIRQLNEIIDSINTNGDVEVTHCSGISGFGWLLCYLKDEGIISTEYDQYLDEFEGFLAGVISDYLDENEFDLLHGAMGIGLFLLKRGKYAAVENILYKLDSTSERSTKETKWSRSDIYDFGLTHGNAGILYFLGKCYELNVLPGLCKKLMEGNVNFYINNIQNVNQAGSYFPYNIKVDGYLAPKQLFTTSKLAWCNGDLGILYTLYNVSSLLKNNEWQAQFLAMLKHTTQRVDFNETFINDAGFCHGTAGSGYIYLKLYQLTGDEAFKHACVFWLDRTLAFGNQNSDSAVNGYIFEKDEQSGLNAEELLLSGLPGVGLLFLASLNYKEPSTWDECFFLS